MAVYSVIKIRRSFGIAALAFVYGCTTSGDNGVLGSAVKSREQFEAENPTQRTALANTRNDLTDYCPPISLREGTETFRLYKKRANRETTEGVRFQATILKTARDCTYEQGQLKMEIGVSGRVINGPTGETGSFKMPLRIAIKMDDNLVYSKLYKLDGTITKGSTYGQFTFVDNQVSFAAPTSKNVKVFVGFDEGPYKTP